MDLFNSTIILGAVLIIAALSGLFSEKGGIVNIAINGMMIIGALSFTIFSSVFKGSSNNYTFIFALLAAGLVTALFALLHGLATIVLKADHVVSGTAINLLASALGLVLAHYLGSKMDIGMGTGIKTAYVSSFVDASSQYPRLETMGLIYFGIALMTTVSIWTYFKYTKAGVIHAAVGENPNAVDSAGIKVNKVKWWAVAISGALAGIAGGILMLKIKIFYGNVQGLGFVALAVMILGQWRPWLIFTAAIGFAFLYGVADKYVFSMVPKDIMKMIPFIASLIALVALSKFQSAPKAVGLHFDKSKR